MTEEPKEKQSEDYQFINEKIVSKKKNKQLKRLGTTLFVMFLAVIFGVVSQAAFLLSEEYLRDWLGLSKGRQEVNLTKPGDGQPKATISPTLKEPQMPSPVPSQAASLTKVPDNFGQGEHQTSETPPAGNGQAGSDIGVFPEATPPAADDTDKQPVENNAGIKPGTAEAYMQMYAAIREVAGEVSSSFVTVEAIEQGVDWFQEVYEKRTRTTGLVLAKDGVDLLILVGTEQFAGATSIEVAFGDEVVDGQIYSMDKDYGLAVIAVPLKQISEATLEQVSLGILAGEEEIVAGIPVIALGAPNGQEGSMEFGMVTSLGNAVPITDGVAAYFTTNIAEYPAGYGFVVNLKGEVMGMITHTHKSNFSDGIFSAVSLDSIRGVIVKLLNNAERVWFGIKGQDVPKNIAKEFELENGVYVSEVENASPALNAGIKAGDIIVSMGGEPIEDIRAFADKVLGYSTREMVQVTLLRKVEEELREMTVDVALTGKR